MSHETQSAPATALSTTARRRRLLAGGGLLLGASAVGLPRLARAGPDGLVPRKGIVSV